MERLGIKPEVYRADVYKRANTTMPSDRLLPEGRREARILKEVSGRAVPGLEPFDASARSAAGRTPLTLQDSTWMRDGDYVCSHGSQGTVSMATGKAGLAVDWPARWPIFR